MNIPDDDIAQVISLTVTEARDLDDVTILLEAIDEAQADVFTGEKKVSYVVIEIKAIGS
jgi:hypothetical protein